MGNRRAVLWLLGGFVLATVAVAASGAVSLVGARQTIAPLRSEADAAIAALAQGDLITFRALLQDSSGRMRKAGHDLESFPVTVLSWMPFLGTEIRAARAGVTAAAELIGAGELLLDYVSDDPPLADGTFNPELIVHLTAVLPDAARRVRSAADVLTTAPIPRLGQLAEALAELQEAADAANDALPGAAQLIDSIAAATADDPFEVLILFENGAELRATGGLVGFTALMKVTDGHLSLDDARVVHDLRVRDEAGELIRVPADPDYERRYGGLAANTSLWLNINLSPHFPSIGPVAAALYEQATGIEPDLVMRLDMVAIGWLLEAFPPTEVEGRPLNPRTIATDFIIDSYLRFPDPQEQNEYLGAVIGEVVATALRSQPDGHRLLGAAQRATAERRLGLWSPEAQVQQAIATMSADGAMPKGTPGNVFVTIQNFAANKIDLYTQTEIELSATTVGCVVVGTARIRLTNAAPPEAADLPGDRYGILGRWWVNVYLPEGANVIGIAVNDEVAPGDIDKEQLRPVAATLVGASQGASSAMTVTWTEPMTAATSAMRGSFQPLSGEATVFVSGTGVRADQPDYCWESQPIG